MPGLQFHNKVAKSGMKEARLGFPTWNVQEEACAVNGLDCTHYEQTGFSSGDWFMGPPYFAEGMVSAHYCLFHFCRLFVQMHHDHPNVPQT